MSYCLIYFESKNKNSNNFSGFSEVGNFTFPSKIKHEKRKIIFENKEYMAIYFFFFDNCDTWDIELIKFINQRLNNDCIIAYLGIYFETDTCLKIPTLVNTESVSINNVIPIFKEKRFKNNQCYQVLKS